MVKINKNCGWANVTLTFPVSNLINVLQVMVGNILGHGLDIPLLGKSVSPPETRAGTRVGTRAGN